MQRVALGCFMPPGMPDIHQTILAYRQIVGGKCSPQFPSERTWTAARNLVFICCVRSNSIEDCRWQAASIAFPKRFFLVEDRCIFQFWLFVFQRLISLRPRGKLERYHQKENTNSRKQTNAGPKVRTTTKFRVYLYSYLIPDSLLFTSTAA